MWQRALALVFAVGCSGGAATLSDDELLRRWYDAMEKQVTADARHVAAERFASRDEADEAVKSLTPVGFRPRPEYFQALYDAAGPPDALARRLAAYAAAHGDDMERRVAPMIAHLKPLMQQVFDNVQRQYPSESPARQ